MDDPVEGEDFATFSAVDEEDRSRQRLFVTRSFLRSRLERPEGRLTLVMSKRLVKMVDEGGVYPIVQVAASATKGLTAALAAAVNQAASNGLTTALAAAPSTLEKSESKRSEKNRRKNKKKKEKKKSRAAATEGAVEEEAHRSEEHLAPELPPPPPSVESPAADDENNNQTLLVETGYDRVESDDEEVDLCRCIHCLEFERGLFVDFDSMCCWTDSESE